MTDKELLELYRSALMDLWEDQHYEYCSESSQCKSVSVHQAMGLAALVAECGPKISLKGKV